MRTRPARAALAAGILWLAFDARSGLAVQDTQEFGVPLEGLGAAQLGRFEAGQVAFERDRSDDVGFGPLYNATSCADCHRQPATGGAGAFYNSAFHAGVLHAKGVFRPGSGRSSSLVHRFRIRSLDGDDAGLENVPSDANAFSRRQTSLLFGLGLVEAIPDWQLLAFVDEDDTNGDGISGRAVLSDSGRVARFGSQDQAASLRGFISEAFYDELGLEEHEIPPGDLDRVVAFVRLLRPPAPRVVPGAAQGAEIFRAIGCQGCHVAGYLTARVPYLTADGESIDVAALQDARVYAYSDFLLHDMGPELDDGVALGEAETYEYRTVPLWGWRHRAGLLHDGRAATLDSALRLHGGEASQARAAYLALSVNDRTQLLAFLQSL